MPLTKQQIAIKCYYEGRQKPKAPPRDRMVLGGKVKLTPRRREILFHIACTDSVWWRAEKDWGDRFSNRKKFVPYLGSTAIPTIVSYLRRMKLVRFSPEAPIRLATDARRYDAPPILLVTERGITALLECLGGL